LCSNRLSVAACGGFQYRLLQRLRLSPQRGALLVGSSFLIRRWPPPTSKLYREGDCSAQPCWHVSWFDVQAEIQATPADALKTGAGLLLGLGGATAATGTTQLVLQLDAWELHVIMQFVVVEVTGVESPGVLGATFCVPAVGGGVGVCARAAPHVAAATMARMIAKVLILASPDSASRQPYSQPQKLGSRRAENLLAGRAGYVLLRFSVRPTPGLQL
jgi:hypothetical protein